MTTDLIKTLCRQAILAAFLTASASSSAYAQANGPSAPLNTTPGATPQDGAGAISPFLMEPEAQIKGDRIKEETFNSQPTGQNQNWNLDIGRFQPKINDDPNRVAPDLEEDYSGIRLRLPLRGGLRQ